MQTPNTETGQTLYSVIIYIKRSLESHPFAMRLESLQNDIDRKRNVL